VLTPHAYSAGRSLPGRSPRASRKRRDTGALSLAP
jgi:hypothetical protein